MNKKNFMLGLGAFCMGGLFMVHCDGQLGGRPLGHDAHAVPNGCADGLSRRPSPGCHLFRLRVR